MGETALARASSAAPRRRPHPAGQPAAEKQQPKEPRDGQAGGQTTLHKRSAVHGTCQRPCCKCGRVIGVDRQSLTVWRSGGIVWSVRSVALMMLNRGPAVKLRSFIERSRRRTLMVRIDTQHAIAHSRSCGENLRPGRPCPMITG